MHGVIGHPFKVVEMAKTPQWKVDKRKSTENARRILGEKQLNRKNSDNSGARREILSVKQCNSVSDEGRQRVVVTEGSGEGGGVGGSLGTTPAAVAPPPAAAAVATVTQPSDQNKPTVPGMFMIILRLFFS